MLDTLIIGNKSSLDDFGASLAKITIKLPKKKSIKETVPFSNATYDFSAINGELYWEERDIECIFEITAPTPEDLERKKTAFSAWVINIQGDNLFSPYDPDYHYKNCTYNDMDYADDDDVEKTTATVKFTAYPYKISNDPKEYNFLVLASSSITGNVINNSAHKIIPTLISDKNITIQLNNTSYSISAGEITDSRFRLETGENNLTLSAGNTNCNLTIRFFEEVF